MLQKPRWLQKEETCALKHLCAEMTYYNNTTEGSLKAA